jgi:hypothetical protein
MNTVFIAMLVAVLTVALVGILSARSAKQRAAGPRVSVVGPVSIGSSQTTAQDPMELAATGAGQTSSSAEKAHKANTGN